MPTQNVAFCTIITSDYIQYALALRESLIAFRKDMPFHILVADRNEGIKEQIEKKYANTIVSSVAEVCSSKIGEAIYNKYYESDITSFRWCMKPVFMSYLLNEKGYDKVIYTDADIYFYNNYDFLLEDLDVNDILLSPHWRSSDPHRDLPNFEILYTSGLYNGGFLGSNRNGIPALEWLAMVCEYICVKDPTQGQFYDQTHLNLLPVYFEKVGIIQHRGCNVANWNMIECKRTQGSNGKVLIADKYPVIFVHFTRSTINGITTEADSLLIPYLEKFTLTTEYYRKEAAIPEAVVPISEKETPVTEKPGRMERIRHIFRRVTN